ncbi:alkaline phosphatase family protein [Mesorhizobium waimense]|uniref:alkaline phosphatase family protein n=1 Tax=Mesorhizobium waimense TaxID=1300307 RepID=UPI001FE09358|nr:alkaline phosphatase family protein [Mesorhizobium waimense]
MYPSETRSAFPSLVTGATTNLHGMIGNKNVDLADFEAPGCRAAFNEGLPHMWNGPVGKVFSTQISVGRCSHMSGLLARSFDRWPR